MARKSNSNLPMLNYIIDLEVPVLVSDLATKSVEELLCSPEFYPLKMDFDRGAISFVPMSRATYQASSFLDGRTQPASSEHFDIPAAELLLAEAEVAPARNPVHYIFHAAFCCSTLLARYLELIPPCFVLKEPLFLTQIAVVRPRGAARHDDGALDPSEWTHLFDLCARLLGRAFAPGDIIAIKVNDICNSLGELLLARNASTKAVFVTIRLKDFLLVLLKSPDRRQWLRGRLLKAQKDAAIIPELVGFDPSKMNDAEGGAYLWTLNETLRARLCAAGQSRVLTLPGEEISDEPAKAVLAVAKHFGLPVTQSLAKDIHRGSTAAKHAKDPSRAYDARSRRKELRTLQKQIGAEADRGVEWAGRHGFLEGRA
jgi:hypothetical protein